MNRQGRVRLHLGCGTVRLPGWINVDRSWQARADLLADLHRGLPLRRADLIFAEHFLEHLDPAAALSLLEACRRVLSDDGVLRLSTPDLDYVWASSYPSRWRALTTRRSAALIVPDEWPHDLEAVRDAFALNKAFHGWGHRFLYNRATLEAALRRAGFAAVDFLAYGESEHEELRGLERHERYPDLAGISHVLVAEATGRAAPEDAPWPAESFAELLRDLAIR